MADQTGEMSEPISTLRGAQVPAINLRRAAQVVLGGCLVALAALVIVLSVAGSHKNAQANRLHNDGVHVSVKVAGCFGLLGGSGSNAGSYQCHGSFVLDNHSYTETIGGITTFVPTGTVLNAISVPGDPALLYTAKAAADEHSTGSVFVFPIVLFVSLVILLILFFKWLRRVPAP